ncbi:MAG: LPXTG cell wall anchor domain-containing protein [Chloroflexi bacterium]|nr:LPXTG cell wall anchor domain-containing protein [Chloroflexota bacterium]
MPPLGKNRLPEAGENDARVLLWVALLLAGGLGFSDFGVRLRFGAIVGARPTLFLLAQKVCVLDFHVLAAFQDERKPPHPNPLPRGEKELCSPRGAVVTPAGSGSLVGE